MGLSPFCSKKSLNFNQECTQSHTKLQSKAAVNRHSSRHLQHKRMHSLRSTLTNFEQVLKHQIPSFTRNVSPFTYQASILFDKLTGHIVGLKWVGYMLIKSLLTGRSTPLS